MTAHRPSPARFRGFTLLEMLLSLGLSVLLIAALVGVMQLPAPEGTEIGDAPAGPDWGLRIIELLRTDFQAAERWYATDGVAILLCRRSTTPPPETDPHRPIFVQYRVEPIAGRSWLIRSEHEVSLDTANPKMVELVAPDVSRFRLRPFIAPSPPLDNSFKDGIPAGTFTNEPAVDPPIASAAPFLDLEALARAMTPLPGHVIVECGGDGDSEHRSPQTWIIIVR